MKKATLLTSLVGIAALALAQTGVFRFEAPMSGNGVASGKAKYKFANRAGRQIQEEIEVEGEDMAPNSTYTVSVNGKSVGTVTTDGFGSFNWTNRRVGGRNYQVQNGTPVSVSGPNGPVMWGTFAPRP